MVTEMRRSGAAATAGFSSKKVEFYATIRHAQ